MWNVNRASTMANRNNDSLRRRIHGNGILLLCVMFMLWTNGCAHTSERNGFGKGGAAVLLPRLTSVTTGAIAVLLTDGNAFSSEFTMTLEGDSKRPLKISGQI